jgi:hypothetical protein
MLSISLAVRSFGPSGLFAPRKTCPLKFIKTHIIVEADRGETEDAPYFLRLPSCYFPARATLPRPHGSSQPHHICPAHKKPQLICRSFIRGTPLESIMASVCGTGKEKVAEISSRQRGGSGFGCRCPNAVLSPESSYPRREETVQGARSQVWPIPGYGAWEGTVCSRGQEEAVRARKEEDPGTRGRRPVRSITFRRSFCKNPPMGRLEGIPAHEGTPNAMNRVCEPSRLRKPWEATCIPSLRGSEGAPVAISP